MAVASAKSVKRGSKSRKTVETPSVTDFSRNGQRLQNVNIPSMDELSSVSTFIQCTEANCDSVFKCTSNLNMHLAKHHKISDGLKKKSSSVKFACPVKDCKHSLKFANYFNQKKHLKQHFLKCHADKNYSCKLCSKGFATESMLKTHSKSCGVAFKCSCGWSYTSKEALLTHCRRKKHDPDNDSLPKYSGPKERSVAQKTAEITTKNESSQHSEVVSELSEDDSQDESNSCELKIKTDDQGEENHVVQVCISSPPHTKSPRKPSNDCAVFPTHYIAAIALSELSTTFIIPKNCHIGVQTVDTKLAKKTRSPSYDKKRKSTQETQTAGVSNKSKRVKISAETQTIGLVKRKASPKNSLRKRKKSTETQTKDQMPFLSSVSGESLDGGIFNESSHSSSSTNNETKREMSTTLDDDTAWGSFQNKQNQSSNSFVTTINSSMFNLNNELTLSSNRHVDNTVTRFTNFDKLCNNETQTELDAIFQTEVEGTSTIETQTTDDLLDDMIYSNMCTQTCDDVTELFDFDFVDIETQTAWPVL